VSKTDLLVGALRVRAIGQESVTAREQSGPQLTWVAALL
jgi:hypothetical protein